MASKSKRPIAQMRAKASVRKAKPKADRNSRQGHAMSSREKVRAYRKRMRAKGLRLVQVWVPDTQKPGRAESAAIRKAWAEALAVQPSAHPVTFDQIAHLAGSVDGPEMDMRHKDEYLRATGYGRKRHR
jgi:hypothetical protein